MRLQQEGQAELSKEERRKRQRYLESIGAPSFQHMLKAGPPSWAGTASHSNQWHCLQRLLTYERMEQHLLCILVL